jgi:hypothetical protein
MTIHDAALGREAAADYSLLLSEAALVLSEMASAKPKDRAEELLTLHDIHAEGAEFVGVPGIPSALRSLFGSIVALGERIAASTTALPEATLAQVHVIESLTRSIAAALDEEGDTHPHIERINRGVAALTLSTPSAKELAAATEAARAALEQYVGKWHH